MSLEKKKHSKKRNFFKIFALCCGSSLSDYDLNSNEEDKREEKTLAEHPLCEKEETTSQHILPIYQQNEHELTDQELHIYLKQGAKSSLNSVANFDRHRLARWKAESRVAEWRAAALAYREGKINSLKGLSEKPDLLENERLQNNPKHSIKFNQGSIEKMNFFDSMELPDFSNRGKSLNWNILIKPAK